MRRSDVPTPALALFADIDMLKSHCDPTVDLCGASHILCGDEAIEIRPIAARYWKTRQ